MPQIRQYPPASTLLATDVFVIDRIGTGTMNIPGTNFIPTALVYTTRTFYQGTNPPGSSQLLDGINLPVPTLWPDTYATALSYGWGLHVETALPTSTYNITMLQNDILRATITINTDGTWNYTSASGLAWAAAIRDRVTLVCPVSADATLNGFFITMAAQVT